MKMFPIIVETNTRWKDNILQIEDFVSMIWTDRYYTPGDFELVVPATSRNLTAIKKGYLVGRVTERGLDENAGIIEYIEKSIDEEGHRRMLIKGRFLGAYFYRRVISNQTLLTTQNTLLNVVKFLCDTNALDPYPVMDERKITGILFDDESATGPTINNLQWTGQNLGESISELCEANHVGWKVTRDGAVFYVSLYEGLDRSLSQSTNQWAVFSEEDGSLLTLTYSENDENKVNSVRVAGEGEGADRRIYWEEQSPTASGYGRYEAWVDARDIQSNNGEISDAAYEAMLRNRAKSAFTDTEYVLEATAAFTNLKYKTDVDLGDLCTIKSRSLGIEVDARLVEVIESIDETGRYSAVPTFSI